MYQLVIAGGTCTEDPSSGVVTCTAPSVELTKTPGACNLKYTSPDVIQVPDETLHQHLLQTLPLHIRGVKLSC